ncbi:MAG TPA: hypothetical protein VFC31_02065 [Candidatus Limnocylindria bacterium]|nr:hypothetical protein [Candidatus Limnocylindria bacterium]
MTTDDRLALRLGALRLARRRGSMRDGAWAAARLRLRGVSLDPADARFAREMLVRYGRALRVARRPRVDPRAEMSVVPLVKPRSRRLWLLAAIAATALLLAFLLITEPATNPDDLAGGGSPVAAGAAAPTYPPLRGRSTNLPVVVQASPAPTAEEPSASPAATVAPTGKPGGATGGAGAGGSGGGSGGGTGSGTGSGGGTRTASPSPTLVPTPSPTVDPSTLMTLRGRVVDARTGRGVPSVCVAPGLNTCIGNTVVYTDAQGNWELTVSIGQQWDIKFLKAGYFVAEIKVPSRAGVYYVPDIPLRPSR